MEIEKKVKDFKSLTKVVKKTDLIDIYLKSCNSWRSEDAVSYKSVSADISFSGSLLEDHEDHFLSKVSFLVRALPTGEEKGEEAVHLDFEYIVTYKLHDRKDILKSDIKSFCNINAIYNAWPYCREFVQNLTSRMELPSLKLPLLKFRPPKKKLDEKKEKK